MLRCMYCHRPIVLPKRVIEAVWERLREDPPSHIDLECPRCGRTNKVAFHIFQQMVPGGGVSGPRSSSAESS